ncbi:hypothetical protein HIM_11314 [Hirsutella minnesotensis 3608]|uniref:Reverse transcriptase Ty1/copia-type domain-containing protein n=1 Tax=Hirsutella minnesotensis 3608 TaxID=1043627 RepID=A0A0F7ZFK5_9HYPO|nr:hypothetical protein HIM_11314 [Hirsutella minnesotensis 3608]
MLALSQAAKESLYVSRLLQELTVKLEASQTTIQCDNQQTIRLMTEEIASLKTKLRHVDVHNHWLRQTIKQGAIQVVYKPTDELIADGLTKALQGPKFEEFTRQLGLHDISERLQAREQQEIKESDLHNHIQRKLEDLGL